MPKQIVQLISRKNRVIVFEDLNFIWDEYELKIISIMWRKGSDILDIANRFGRDPDEVILALIHLAREGEIKQRRGGCYLDYSKANLGQLHHLARFTEFRVDALLELERRDHLGYQTTKKSMCHM